MTLRCCRYIYYPEGVYVMALCWKQGIVEEAVVKGEFKLTLNWYFFGGNLSIRAL